MKHPRDLTLAEMVASIREKDLTSTEIIESCLEAVDLHEKTLNAFISLDREKVLSQSRMIDGAGKKTDESFLCGAPVGVKDLIDVSWERTTSGSSFFKNAAAALTDANVIRTLKKNGAVLFGKTNLHEFAWGGTTENPHFGNCKNPWNPGHSPGGSSGGSAAAVASRMVPAALGTDTLGSIRIPSSFCGIVGLKPTYGLVPTTGVFPLGYTFDHVGPMARTTADAGLLFNAMIDRNRRQRLEQKAESTRPTRPAGKDSRRLQGLKIGFLPALVPEQSCHETVYRQFRLAFDFAADEGAQIVEGKFPGMDMALFVGYIMTLAQAAEIHHERLAVDPNGFGDDVRELLESGHFIGAVDYIRAQRVRAKLVLEAKALMKRVDAWILPTTPAPASSIGGPVDANLAMFTGPINVLGFPAVALPSGLTEDRLPVSIQIIAGPFDEYLLLEIARVFEDRFAFPKDPPDWVKTHPA